MSFDKLEISFGEWLQFARRKTGLNVEEFAKKTDVDAGTISRLENGRTQVQLDTVIRLCSGVSVLPYEFIKWFLKDEPSALLKEREEIPLDSLLILTIHDVESFLQWFRQNQKMGSQWLIDLFNEMANLFNESHQDTQEVTHPNFIVQDIERLLITLPFFKFELSYPTEIDNETILRIYSLGGVLTSNDAGIYIRNLRLQRQLILTEIEKIIGRSKSVLSNIEMGSLERIKLLDVMLMDDFYQQEGKIFALYWQASEFNARIMQSERWTEREAKVGSLLVTIARWRQILNWDDQSWVSELRKKVQEGTGEAQLEPVA